jgi:hypothetical protein
MGRRDLDFSAGAAALLLVENVAQHTGIFAALDSF